MRQIVLDTETTGLEVSLGHRIIEIGCVEIINRKLTGNHFHEYINPEREIDQGAFEVHGISNEFLNDKPTFAAVADKFLDYVNGAELIIHNAKFDVGFIDAELGMLGAKVSKIETICKVTDSLLMAREKHPGQRNSLDALSKRYEVENFDRSLHGALLDSEILAEVYLRMTGGQTALGLSALDSQNEAAKKGSKQELASIDFKKRQGKIISANAEELAEHEKLLKTLDKKVEGTCLWNQMQTEI